ncbi:MAG: DUF2892 domain-containing protein [Thermoflexales bacterium]
MVKNVGSVDRAVRILIALVLAALIVSGTLQGALAIVLGVVVAVFALTSVTGTCPLYIPLRISTRGR